MDPHGHADNAPAGLTIDYWLKDKRKDPAPDAPPAAIDANRITLEILDAQGQHVRTLSSVPIPNRYGTDDPDQPEKPAKPELTTDQGLNRIQWDLRYDGAKRLEGAKIDAGDPDHGPMVLPGIYTLKLTVDGRSVTTQAEVLADPRSPVPAEELRQNVGFALQARSALNQLTDDINAVRAIREQANELKQRTSGNAAAANLQTLADAVVKQCNTLENRMQNPDAKVVYDVLAGRDGGAKLYAQIAPLFSDIQSSDYAPTQGQLDQMAENLADLKSVEDDLAGLRSGELARLEAEAASLQLPRVILPSGR
jgi:hypothetical protein